MFRIDLAIQKDGEGLALLSTSSSSRKLLYSSIPAIAVMGTLGNVITVAATGNHGWWLLLLAPTVPWSVLAYLNVTKDVQVQFDGSTNAVWINGKEVSLKAVALIQRQHGMLHDITIAMRIAPRTNVILREEQLFTSIPRGTIAEYEEQASAIADHFGVPLLANEIAEGHSQLWK